MSPVPVFTFSAVHTSFSPVLPVHIAAQWPLMVFTSNPLSVSLVPPRLIWWRVKDYKRFELFYHKRYHQRISALRTSVIEQSGICVSYRYLICHQLTVGWTHHVHSVCFLMFFAHSKITDPIYSRQCRSSRQNWTFVCLSLAYTLLFKFSAIDHWHLLCFWHAGITLFVLRNRSRLINGEAVQTQIFNSLCDIVC